MRDPKANLQKLWRRAFTSTAWLFEHDKQWLEAACLSTGPANNANTFSQASALEDKQFATLVEAAAREAVLSSSKPQRLTLSRLPANVPKKGIKRQSVREQYPLLSEQILLCRETAWSFTARRLLWSLSEINRLDLSVTQLNICRPAAISAYAVTKIVKFARWDLEELAARPIKPLFELFRVSFPAHTAVSSTNCNTGLMNRIGLQL